MSTSRLRKSVASLETFDCQAIEKDSRDAVALSHALCFTLEEAEAGQVGWSEREAIINWLHKNKKALPESCTGLSGQLEYRLSFTFLPGLSWPGYAAATAGEGGTGGQRGPRDPKNRRNLAGLSPPLGKNVAAVEASAAAAVAASTKSTSATSCSGGASVAGGRTATEDGNYSSTDDEAAAAGAGVLGFGGAASRDGLGSPEVLPSVLEQETVNASTLEGADDAFLLQPTPRGVKSYCIIQRTSSTIRVYFRLFLQEQRPFGDPAPPPPASAAAATAAATADTATGGWGVGGNSSAGTGNGSVSSGPSGGMETLRAFLVGGGMGGGGGSGGIAGTTGITAAASTAGVAEVPGGGSSGGEGGAGRSGRFLLSSKRYRSSRVRSASYIWGKNGVWKDKQALARVSTNPWSGGKSVGTVSSPSLIGDRPRSFASPISGTSAPSLANSPRDDVGGLDGKARSSPARSGSSGGGGGGSRQGSGCRVSEGGGNQPCWAVLVNVQPEGEARLLSVAAIVPDLCAPINNAAGVGATSGGGGAGSDQALETALAEGLRSWERTGVSPQGMIVLRSRQPQWSAWQGCHTLEFDRGDDRVREPSRKNVSMVGMDGASGVRTRGSGGSGSCFVGGHGRGSGRKGVNEPRGGEEGETETLHRSTTPPMLQVGKISEHLFSLDFCWPLSPLQAFVIAMTIFDG